MKIEKNSRDTLPLEYKTNDPYELTNWKKIHVLPFNIMKILKGSISMTNAINISSSTTT